MTRAVGVGLILVGLGVGSSVFAIGSEAEQNTYRPGVDKARPAGNPVIAATVEPEPRAERVRPPAPKPQLATRPASSPIPVVVTLPQRIEPAAGAAPKAQRSPPDRAALARELQSELRRMGCYGGEINGVWTAATRKAMKTFTDRVNATLPIDEPDFVLLALLEAHQGEACGKPCQAGQGLADNGRCLPSAVLAHAARTSSPADAETVAGRGGRPAEKRMPVIAGWSTTTTAAILPPAPSLPPIGRMALAGPKTDVPIAGAEPPPPGPARVVAKTGRESSGRFIERRPERVAQGTPARRSGFVESILFNRHSQY